MRDHCVNSQFEFVRPANASSAAEVASFYQMLGTVESYDEAMVALALSLRVPLSDVVYIASKNSSQEHAIDANGARLISHGTIAGEPDEVRQFAAGSFRERNQLDYALWEEAKRRSSRSAAAAGFSPLLARYKRMQARASSACGFDPAKSKGTKCYFRDNGCNYECLDRLQWESDPATHLEAWPLAPKPPDKKTRHEH